METNGMRRMSSLDNFVNGTINPRKTKAIKTRTETLNPWDVKILKFDAYSKEEVSNSQQEGYRIRKVHIYYYLQDDSMAIFEPRTENSGLRQGKVLRRQRVVKDEEIGFWNWTDFNLGVTIKIYGTPYRIINCDEWTKNFLFTNGILVNESEEMPLDPYQSRRQQAKVLQIPIFKTPSSEDKLWKFLNFDRQVLRFYSILEERGASEQDTRPVVLQYYLVDDTIEIRESHQTNDGRDPYPIAFRRQRVPRNGKLATSYPIAALDDLLRSSDEFLSPKDFTLGKIVEIFGRRVLLCDCDDFTKDYYRKYLGVKEFKVVSLPRAEEAQVKDSTRPQVTPPYTGFGTPEDSAQSFKYLTPRPPKKNLVKFLENDTKVLRFQAVFEKPVDAVEEGRKFIVSYYLADDTISIYEPQVVNSGVLGGKYQERKRVLKPGSDLSRPDYYSYRDLFVGSLLEAAGRTFKLTDADKYVYRFVQKNSHNYPSSAVEAMSVPEVET